MARQRRPAALGKRAAGRSFAGKSKKEKQTEQRRARNAKRGAKKNYEQHWIPGYATRHASKTGILLTEHQVRRSKEFQEAAAIVRTAKRRSKRAGGPLAKALVTLGLREPSFRGAVGNSPTSGVRTGAQARRSQSRGSRRERAGLSKHRNTP